MSDSLKALFGEDAESASDSLAELQSDRVSELSALAQKLSDKEKSIQELEARLKQAKEDMYKISDEDIPALMEELGVRSFKLKDGAEVSVSPTYGGHISKAYEDEAFNWLRENGYDDIIKNVISVNFGKGEDQKADELYRSLEAQGLLPSNKTGVHPQTLKAFIRERVENGEDFPGHLFGAHIGQRAKIKRTK